MTQDITKNVNAFLRRLEMYDFSEAQAMCTEKATVWQNDGKGEQAMDERLEQFQTFVAAVDSLRYDVIRQFQNADEVLHQHVLHVNMEDGSSNEIHAAVHFRFENDLIDQIQEYVYTVPTEEAP